MKKFLRDLVFFALTFFLFDKLFIPLLLRAPSSEQDTRLEQVLEGELGAELLIFGSSRGARNILAADLADSLACSAFNLAYPGADISFNYFLLNLYLRFNQKPKIILLALDDPALLWDEPSLRFRFDRIYPLLKYNVLNDMMIERGEHSVWSHFMALGRLHKSHFTWRKTTPSLLDTVMACGSMPLDFQRTGRRFQYLYQREPYEVNREQAEKRADFIAFQQRCLAEGLDLYLVFPPNYQVSQPSFEARIRELALKEVALIHYDTSNSIYRDRAYFYDEAHLQLKGAKIFSAELASALKSKRRKTPIFSPD